MTTESIALLATSAVSVLTGYFAGVMSCRLCDKQTTGATATAKKPQRKPVAVAVVEPSGEAGRDTTIYRVRSRHRGTPKKRGPYYGVWDNYAQRYLLVMDHLANGVKGSYLAWSEYDRVLGKWIPRTAICGEWVEADSYVDIDYL